MKVILTIEVPDDFKKGDGWNCPYSRDIAIGGSNFTKMIEVTRSCYLTTNHCNVDNCPLEIQDEFTELEQKCLKHIGELIVENATLKENNQ